MVSHILFARTCVVCCVLWLLCAGVCFASGPAEENPAGNTSIVRINNAQRTEYRKDKDSGNEVMVLTGSVSVTVTNGSSRTDITASTMKYDRKTNMLFAQGDIHLVQEDGSGGGQDIYADTLLFNTSTLEGIFDNSRIIESKSNALNLPADSTLSVSSKIFGRNASGTVAFKDAKLTFCSDPDPHWSIKASRIWMLPGGEFAFLNAVLYVGHVPLMYLPAFYYPKDELIFNPVFGYDNRKGYYFQTTTYLIGRKPLSAYEPVQKEKSKDDLTESGTLGDDVYNFMRPTVLKEQRREGLVLHNLDKNYSGSTDDYLKLMADYYGNFGGYTGLDGAYKSNKDVVEAEGFIGLGFSNTVFYRKGRFTQYAADDLVYEDGSNFLGVSLPFRYAANLKFSVKKPFTFTLSMPTYSDPYFQNDFGDRKEFMDWIGFLTSSSEITADQLNTDESARRVTTFSWDASASYYAPVADLFSPYLSTLAVKNLSASILFNSMKRTDPAFYAKPADWQTYSPERMFFYPSQVTPVSVTTEIAGTLYEYPARAKTGSSRKSGSSGAAGVAGLEVPDELKPPVAEKDDAEAADASRDGVFSFTDLPDLETLPVPPLMQTDGIAYKLGYSVTPHYISQITYNSLQFKDSSDFKWGNMYSSYYKTGVPVALTSDLSYRRNFVSLRNTLTFEPEVQEHPNLDGYTTKSSKDSVTVTDYNAKKLDLTEENRFAFRPFIYDPVFKDTSLEWNTKLRVIRTKFIGDADNPSWDYLTADLSDKESLTANTLIANISATESDQTSQVFTLTSALPPQTEEYTESLRLTFPHVTASFATGVKRVENTDHWEDKPFQQSASVQMPLDVTFTESYNYNLAENHEDSLKLALSRKGFQLGYTMQYTYGYDFDKTSGWKSRGYQEFLPYSLSVAYVTKDKVFRYWKNRITWAPALDTSLVYDFIRPTNSYFVFIPSLTFRINRFLDISFSSESRNSVIFRYFQDYTDYGDVLSGEEDMMVDLFNSFAFWDTTLETRKNSGFKLKNLKIMVKHNLCDWDFASSFTFQPRLISESGARPYFSYEPYFTFAVTWRPMSGIKTQVTDNYGSLELNP